MPDGPDSGVHTKVALRSFAIPLFDGFAKLLVIDDPLEVGPLSRRGVLYPSHYSAAFASSSILCPLLHQSPLR
jgi:hypothetical protein